eukprot:COSAG04_NODE_1482_length_6564_cov_3.075019_4_plen_173_part_01
MPLTEEWVWTPDPASPELWIYTNTESYTAGDAVTFHGSCTLPPAEGSSSASAVITITRDSLEPEQVYASEPFDVACHEAPEQCYATGCGWPVCFTLDAIPQGWASGFYIVRCEASAQQGGAVGAVAEHFFVVRPSEPPTRSELLLVLSTNTWTSYNAWGGANAYRGLLPPVSY